MERPSRCHRRVARRVISDSSEYSFDDYPLRPSIGDRVRRQLYSNVAQTTPVDSESITDEFRIGIHSTTHNFDNYLEIGIFKRVDPSDSLAELAEKTATSEQMTCMGNSTFTRLTNNREETVSWTTFPRLHCPTVGSGVTYERLTKSF